MPPFDPSQACSITPHDTDMVKQLEKEFRPNQTDVALLDVQAALHLWLAASRSKGIGEVQALETLKGVLSDASLDAAWDNIEGFLSFGKSYTATALDLKLLAELGKDLSKGGSFLSQYTLKVYNGQHYIAIKGYAGLRSVLTGTRYLAANTKVTSMGIGTLGAAKSIKSGMVISIFLSIGFRAIEQFMNDEATWHLFVGGVASDVAKIAVAGGASMIAASMAGAGAATVGAIAVGPIFAAIVVGVAVGYALDYADDKYGFTDALVNAIREAESNIVDQYQEAKRQYNWYTRNPIAEYNFLMRIFGAQY